MPASPGVVNASRSNAVSANDNLILAGAITPANQPEEEAAPELQKDIALQGFGIGELNIDRGYIASPLVDEIIGADGEVEQLRFGSVVEFDPEVCDPCRLRHSARPPLAGVGRTVTANEKLQHKLRKLQASPRGRAKLRERAAVEHRPAYLPRRQGRRARYRGIRKNLFDLRRACAIQNLETIQRKAA